jgi:hypothetical protein
MAAYQITDPLATLPERERGVLAYLDATRTP